jgi:hypothetical protein
MTNDEIVPGDKRARIVAILRVLGGLALIVSAPWVANFVASVGIDGADPEKAMAELAFRYKLMTVVGAIPLIALALFYARRGFTITRAHSNPPSAMKVPWSVRGRNGRLALFIGLGHLTIAAMLLLLAAIGFWFWPRWT